MTGVVAITRFVMQILFTVHEKHSHTEYGLDVFFLKKL